MTSCFVYISPNPITGDKICCGLLVLDEKGVGHFRWSKEKVRIAMSLIPDKKKRASTRSLIKTMLKNIERYKSPDIRKVVEHSRIHGTGLIQYGEFRPSTFSANELMGDDYFGSFVENKSFN